MSFSGVLQLIVLFQPHPKFVILRQLALWGLLGNLIVRFGKVQLSWFMEAILWGAFYKILKSDWNFEPQSGAGNIAQDWKKRESFVFLISLRGNLCCQYSV